MHKVELSYVLTSGRAPEALIRNPLMDLLAAVRAQGSISAAARAMGHSYRHVWGELKRWEKELGHCLIVWERGQPARLTEFADKLLWAERQAQARLAPQIAALHFDLSVHNFGIQEYMRHTEETDAVFPHQYAFADGYLHPGDAPGLGVDLDEKLAARYPYRRAYLPVNRLEDGTLHDW